MRTVIRYQCEKCQKIYPASHAAFLCEAGHYGLTVEEYSHWLALKKLAEDTGRKTGIAKNEKTEAAFDEAVQKLLSFEKEHHLEGF